jgi:methionyl aminopeptidase
MRALQPGVYGYGLPRNPPKTVTLPMASANRLYKTIRENFGTIVFCRRNLEYLGLEKYLAGVSAFSSFSVSHFAFLREVLLLHGIS